MLLLNFTGEITTLVNCKLLLNINVASSEKLFCTLLILELVINQYIKSFWGFPGGAVVKNLPASAGDTGWIPGLGRSHMWQNN